MPRTFRFTLHIVVIVRRFDGRVHPYLSPPIKPDTQPARHQ